MTHVPEQQRRQVEGARARMSTAAALMAGSVAAVVVVAIVLYLVLR